MQSIVGEKRHILGKKVNNLRKKGLLPAVIYGKGKDSESISINEADFLKLWKAAGESSIVELELGGKKRNVLIQEVATDPLKDKPTHVDFYSVDMTKPVKVGVQLMFTGEPGAVKAGAVLVKILHALEIEALPKDLPHEIMVDLVLLKNTGDSIKVKDLAMPKGVTVLASEDDTIIIAEAPRSEEELKTAEAAAELSLENIEVVGKKLKAEEKALEAPATESPKAKNA